MQYRAIRVPVWDVFATFSGVPANIVNLSKTGVLLAVHRNTPLGEPEGFVTFELDDGERALRGRVVREHVERPTPRDHEPMWHIAIEFTDDLRRTLEVVHQVMAAQRFIHVG
ncbi:MAG: PilZ domain-containing protein [Acidobacteria bacterium]|nr:PilZ domain-containing protein [Acidobacteriota bacterium]